MSCSDLLGGKSVNAKLFSDLSFQFLKNRDRPSNIRCSTTSSSFQGRPDLREWVTHSSLEKTSVELIRCGLRVALLHQSPGLRRSCNDALALGAVKRIPMRTRVKRG